MYQIKNQCISINVNQLTYQSVNVSSEEKRILQDLIIIRLHVSQEKISKRRGANFYLREPRLQKGLTICEQLDLDDRHLDTTIK